MSIIKGIKDNKLISKPIQIPNQELEEIVINVPNIIIKKKINFDEFFSIKKERLILYI
jgi:hypothetical protein